ncbi:681_t:CDS:2 [Scutellospora calospora]|uniref:681_t:CDS:1 n=1 Tax=Scutellospora calospora TaxID=85575 RepID=A0ACA9L5L4_9GLOM|nr:681_t:CDS:2 [Scutellospora calospora]
MTKSKDELSSCVSYDTVSPHLTSTYFSPQYEFQEQSEFTNNSHQNEDIVQITLDQFLKAPDIEILTNNVVNSKPSNNGNEKNQQIEKNSGIIKSDKSIQTIPSMFAKLDSHKLVKQQKLVVEDCQALTIVERLKFHMWTSMHCLYIGITIYWLSKNFELYQAVLTIEEFPYSHSGERQKQFLFKIFEYWNIRDKLIRGTTDNNKSVVKGMRLLEIPHTRCTAYTIQLAIKDGLSAYDNILKDSELPLLENENSDLEPENLFESLAQSKAVKQLAKSLNYHSEYQQKKDEQNLSGKLLSEEEWNELEDLLKLLSPFTQSTKLIRVFQIFVNELKTPLMKKKRVQDMLLEMIEAIANAVNTLVQMEMDQLYDSVQLDFQ